MTSTEVLRTERSCIQKTPGVCGGDACIRDIRMPVWLLVDYHRLGISKDALRTHFVAPLTAADVEAAFAYYEQHPEEIEEAIRANDEA